MPITCFTRLRSGSHTPGVLPDTEGRAGRMPTLPGALARFAASVQLSVYSTGSLPAMVSRVRGKVGRGKESGSEAKYERRGGPSGGACSRLSPCETMQQGGPGVCPPPPSITRLEEAGNVFLNRQG
ncbi:MAG TPA: hypothetical protein VHT73_15920 [Thermodesulfobacteriota bacterium]|nr:hypothetical protein [Thermodesulfobacteriota bacterium]